MGERVYVSGTIALYDGMRQMVHPDRVVSEQDLAKLPLLDPVYPLTEGLSALQVHRAADAALARVPSLPEWQDEGWLKARAFPSLRGRPRPPAPAATAGRRRAGGAGMVAPGL